MSQRDRCCLMFGIVAGVLYLASPAILGALLPHYDPVRQTISVIGKTGAPFEVQYKMLFLAAALCLVPFAYGVYRFSLSRGLSPIPGFILGYLAVMKIGVAIFEAPHPLHNDFGLSSLLGYLAPLGLALSWRRAPSQITLRRISAVVAAVVVITMGVHMLDIFIAPPDWFRENYGLIQRAMLVPFELWCIYCAVVLFRSSTEVTGDSFGSLAASARS